MSDDSSEPALKNEEVSDKAVSRRWSIGSKNSGRNFGGPWRITATFIAIFIISQLIAGLLVSFGLSLTHHDTGLGTILENNAALQFLYILIAEGLAAGLVILVLKNRGLRPTSIGLGRRPQWRDASKALVGIAIFYALVIIVTGIITTLVPQLNIDQPQDVGFKSIASSLDQILAFVALVILAPVGEEILVRGYLYSALRSRWRFMPAMVVTSVLFGAAHLGSGTIDSLVWGAALTTFLLSAVLVYLREKTGALYAGIIVHAVNNLIAFTVYFHRVLF